MGQPGDLATPAVDRGQDDLAEPQMRDAVATGRVPSTTMTERA
jgi:hypothetical protein